MIRRPLKFVNGNIQEIAVGDSISVSRSKLYGERGVFAGGLTTGDAIINTAEFITIMTTMNSQTFGNLANSSGRRMLAGCSDSVRGIFSGGYTNTVLNRIDYITFATKADTTYFGDLVVKKSDHTSVSNGVIGIFAGGYDGVYPNTISYVTIQTTNNSVNWGGTLILGGTYDNMAQAACSNGTLGIFFGGY